jgi:hypothetical protein
VAAPDGHHMLRHMERLLWLRYRQGGNHTPFSCSSNVATSYLLRASFALTSRNNTHPRRERPRKSTMPQSASSVFPHLGSVATYIAGSAASLREVVFTLNHGRSLGSRHHDACCLFWTRAGAVLASGSVSSLPIVSTKPLQVLCVGLTSSALFSFQQCLSTALAYRNKLSQCRNNIPSPAPHLGRFLALTTLHVALPTRKAGKWHSVQQCCRAGRGLLKTGGLGASLGRCIIQAGSLEMSIIPQAPRIIGLFQFGMSSQDCLRAENRLVPYRLH